jgi:hypothetical protein
MSVGMLIDRDWPNPWHEKNTNRTKKKKTARDGFIDSVSISLIFGRDDEGASA